jgi:hypothetical protein
MAHDLAAHPFAGIAQAVRHQVDVLDGDRHRGQVLPLRHLVLAGAQHADADPDRGAQGPAALGFLSRGVVFLRRREQAISLGEALAKRRAVLAGEYREAPWLG